MKSFESRVIKAVVNVRAFAQDRMVNTYRFYLIGNSYYGLGVRVGCLERCVIDAVECALRPDNLTIPVKSSSATCIGIATTLAPLNIEIISKKEGCTCADSFHKSLTCPCYILIAGLMWCAGTALVACHILRGL